MSLSGVTILNRVTDGFYSSDVHKEVSIEQYGIGLGCFTQTRPGLLAGLYEFPTSANVPKSMTSDAMAQIPNTLLSRLLLFTVPPYNENNKNAKKSYDTLQIKDLHSVGDVVHVFSHIKKTYRTQWVVLEGGDHPPSLRQGVTEQLDKHEGTSNAEKLSNCGDDEISTSLSIPGAMWTKLEDVPDVKYVACHYLKPDLIDDFETQHGNGGR